MLTKRFFFGAMLLISLVIISGCATTDEPKDSYKAQYNNVSNECIRWGHRRGSYDYHRCIENKLEIGKRTLSREQD